MILEILFSASAAIGIVYTLTAGWIAFMEDPTPLNYLIVGISFLVLAQVLQGIQTHVKNNKDETSVSE
jgi:multidrug transporter EmrE-like cation transporter